MFQLLVAEDDKNYAKYLKIVLTQAGYKVFHAANGVEALEIMDKNDCGYVRYLLRCFHFSAVNVPTALILANYSAFVNLPTPQLIVIKLSFFACFLRISASN